MAKGGVYPPLLWLVQYLRVRGLPPPAAPAESPYIVYLLSFFYKIHECAKKFKSKVVNIFIDSDGLKSKVMENIIGLKRYGA